MEKGVPNMFLLRHHINPLHATDLINYSHRIMIGSCENFRHFKNIFRKKNKSMHYLSVEKIRVRK